MLGPILQSPDDLMQIPIGDQLARTAGRVERMCKFIEMMTGDPSDTVEELAERERTLCLVAAIAVDARAKEVCRYCESIAVVRATPQLVRAKPLEVALVVSMQQRRMRDYHER